jgi:hypothetical protein
MISNYINDIYINHIHPSFLDDEFEYSYAVYDIVASKIDTIKYIVKNHTTNNSVSFLLLNENNDIILEYEKFLKTNENNGYEYHIWFNYHQFCDNKLGIEYMHYLIETNIESIFIPNIDIAYWSVDSFNYSRDYDLQYSLIDYSARQPIQNKYNIKSIIDKYILQEKYYSIEFKMPPNESNVIVFTNLYNDYKAMYIKTFYNSEVWKCDRKFEENEFVIGWKYKD